MTKRVGNVVIIAVEPDRACELCGAFTECRPYGPKGEQICHACGRKHPDAVKAAMARLFAEAKGVIIRDQVHPALRAQGRGEARGPQEGPVVPRPGDRRAGAGAVSPVVATPACRFCGEACCRRGAERARQLEATLDQARQALDAAVHRRRYEEHEWGRLLADAERIAQLSRLALKAAVRVLGA